LKSEDEVEFLKKLFLIISIFVFTLALTGCGKYNASKIVKELSNDIKNIDAYYLQGTMDIYNNEDVYSYDVKVSYQKDDNYRVSLTNQLNNHEQIILRNNEGVYVLTPSLNKSFKFQSQWPYNNSQIYLLQSIIDDLSNEDEIEFKESNDRYILISDVNYPNNSNLEEQIVYIDKNFNIKQVDIIDDNEIVQMKMTFDTIDKKATFNDNYFDLNENLSSASVNTEKSNTVSKIEDVIYPMYLPTGTYLQSQSTVSKSDGERVIMTFEGDNAFTLIQETVSMTDQNLVVSVNGDPEILADTVGVIDENSVSWISNGIEYYIVSENMSSNEMLTVAKSISAIPVSK